MNHAMGNKAEYAVSTWQYEDDPIETAIDKIKKSGFNRIELWADQVHADPRLHNLSIIKRALSDSDVTVHSIHAPFSVIGDGFPGSSFFQKWENLLIETAQYGSEVYSGLVVLHILNRKVYNVFRNDIASVYDFIGRMCEKFRTYGVKIILENLVGSGVADEFECTISELRRVFGSLDIGYCIDISHSVLTHQDIKKEIKTAGNKLLSVHVSNTDGIRDIHALPDRGVINWGELREVFRNNGYQGAFVLEINGMHCPDEIMNGIITCFDT